MQLAGDATEGVPGIFAEKRGMERIISPEDSLETP